MQNREFDTGTETKPRLSRQVVKRQRDEHETRDDSLPQRDSFEPVISGIGDASSAGVHASMLNRATKGRPFRAARSLLRLQRQYGNRYVQRVLALAGKGRGDAEVAPELEQSIQQARGSGQALDSKVRTQMESAFGADFGDVRVHTDTQADTLNRELNARAFTTGQDIFFRNGAHSPGTSRGRELLAHELTHVVQQNGDKVQRKLAVGQPGDKYEQEADQVARAVIQQEQKATQMQVEEKKKEESVRTQRQAEEKEEEEVQMQPEEEEEEWLQMKVEALVAQRQITKGNTSIHTTPVLQKQYTKIKKLIKKEEKKLKEAGWKQQCVMIILKDFRGKPLWGYMLYADFEAPGVAVVTEGSEVKGGAIIWSDVWLKPEGIVTLFAVTLGTPTIAPRGTTFYKLSERGPLKLEAVQGSKEVTVTAATSEEAATKVGATGVAGVDFKVFSVGGEVSREKEEKKGVSLSKTWKVIFPAATLKIKQIK